MCLYCSGRWLCGLWDQSNPSRVKCNFFLFFMCEIWCTTVYTGFILFVKLCYLLKCCFYFFCLVENQNKNVFALILCAFIFRLALISGSEGGCKHAVSSIFALVYRQNHYQMWHIQPNVMPCCSLSFWRLARGVCNTAPAVPHSNPWHFLGSRSLPYCQKSLTPSFSAAVKSMRTPSTPHGRSDRGASPA